jgi:hypothetical protein
MSKTFTRVVYEDAPNMSEELVDYLQTFGLLEDFKVDSSYIYIDSEKIKDIKQKIKECSKDGIAEDFDSWINQVKPFIKDGFDYVIIW